MGKKGGIGMTELYFMNNASYTQMMGFIVRSGEHTVVIDGGMKEDADNLLSHLEKTGAKKVDAWFMTHPHCDHYGALQRLAEEGRLPEIGAVYESSTPDDYLDSKKGEIAPGEDREARVYNAIERGTVHNLKKGEHFEFGDIKIDILRVFNPDITFNFGNNASVVMKVYDKKSVLILGDLGIEAGDEVMASCSAEELDADYVQMAHHGQKGVRKEFYEYIKPKACLWAAPVWLWNNDEGTGFDSGPYETVKNRRWIEEIGTAKEHFKEYDGPHKIEL